MKRNTLPNGSSEGRLLFCRVRSCTRRAVFCFFAVLLSGCRAKSPSTPEPQPNDPKPRVVAQSPLPLKLSEAEWERTVLNSLEKRIVGRRETWGDIERVVTQISPFVQEAAHLPELQADFQAMAMDNNLSLDAMRQEWIAVQEADLLMESGGKDDAISPSEACGVAQWLAGSGRASGLKVDLKESRRLTAKINPIKIKAAWLEYLARPNAQRDLPSSPNITQQEAIAQLPALRAELELLQTKRRRVDKRFTPRQAVFAQTRYLVMLYRKFPGIEWLYQAYHGGAGGAAHTLKLYTGANFANDTASAIRYGDNGTRLRWETVYRNLTPKTHSAAFDYVYGRSDDHRHYWWKLRVCRAAIARYRADKTEFESYWRTLLPGRSKEVLWYPDAEALSLPHPQDKQTGLNSGKLAINRTLMKTSITAAPQTLGTLSLVTKWYRANGGKEPLVVDADWLSVEEIARRNAAHPPPRTVSLLPPDTQDIPLATTVPYTFDFHTTGLALDIRKPQNKRDAKILDYVLGWMEDREIIWRLERKNAVPPCHHIVPNPRYADALRSLSPKDSLPVDERLPR